MYRQCLKINPNYEPAQTELKNMGALSFDKIF